MPRASWNRMNWKTNVIGWRLRARVFSPLLCHKGKISVAKQKSLTLDVFLWAEKHLLNKIEMESAFSTFQEHRKARKELKRYLQVLCCFLNYFYSLSRRTSTGNKGHSQEIVYKAIDTEIWYFARYFFLQEWLGRFDCVEKIDFILCLITWVINSILKSNKSYM